MRFLHLQWLRGTGLAAASLAFATSLSTFNVNADIDPDTFAPEIRALEWREVGPFRGGRSAAVAGLPGDRDKYYFGSTGGGVWMTDNGGTSWDNISDGYFGGSIGAVAVSEWDPNVIYVGTGEKTVRGNVSPGDGMWKSMDAGDTWAHIGLEDSQHISRVRIHPTNPDVAYAAVMGHLFGPNDQRGVFRTTDGGDNWEKVLFVNDEVGAVDLAMDPSNPRILYASFWRVKRTPYSLESGGEGSGLYKSVDGGDNWEELTRNDGLPRGTIGISGVTVSPSNNKNVYAIIEAEDGGVFRSRDGGKTWAKTSENRNLRQRAWYYTRIFADPADEEAVYVANVRFHFSKDGGKTFSEIDTPHGDNHDLWIDPADPMRMIQSNDGGANVSYDRGETWSTQANQPTVQFYRVATDNDFPYRLLGGQQDNSAVRIRSRSAMGSSIGIRDWEPTAGGESGHIAAKPDDPDVVVGGSYGGLMRLVNHRTGERRALDVWPDNPMGWGAAEVKYRFQWNYPIAFSKHDPDVLFVSANAVFRSDDLGYNWTQISPDLTVNDKSRMGKSGGPITKDDTGVEYYGTVFVLTESHHEAGVLWAGSDDGKVHVTRDGGENWKDVTPSALPEWAMVNSIDIDPFNEGGAYLAATRYKMDDFKPYLFYTDNWGRSWKRISGNIPDDHFTRVVRADTEREGLLFAGTERGAYYSLNNGDDWSPIQLNLPIVPVTDMQIKNGDLIAATQGRGFWIMDDLSTLRQLPEKQHKTAHLYTPRPSYRMLSRGWDRSKGPAGTNPDDGVALYYTLPDDLADDAAIELSVYKDGDDDAIWTWSREPGADDEKMPKSASGEPDTRVLSADAGLNRYVWNLDYPGMKRFDGLILWSDKKTGPRAVPGQYRAELAVDGERQSVAFEVVKDPRSTATPQDLAAQFDFVLETRDLLSRIHEEIGQIRSFRSQLDALESRLVTDGDSVDDPSPLLGDVLAMGETITAVEEALYQTKNQSRQDPLNFPIRLNNKLVSLMGMVATGDAAPTSQAMEFKTELTATIEAQLSTLQRVWNDDVPALNEQIKAQGMDMISLGAD
ncbi:WD40/YVTN/BNR-like repeat-containing protein [Congregibacter sp.]|uniref:WD40/YVTN/BNR-like repeat-containing protein n=1 Tax=Congregibacter sp. TaxID=2744308 RepID=UPI003F6D5090